MPDRVVDASVIAAMVFEEPRGDEAEDLLRGATLFAPEILRYELASVALKKTRSSPLAKFDIGSRLGAALSLGVELVPIVPIEVFRLALENNLTVYDAAYLHTALRVRCPLVTFDAKLARQARNFTRA